MKTSDYQQFSEMWGTANEIAANSKVLSNNAMMQVFSVLQNYTLQQIKTALFTHSKINKFAPTPADIVKIIEGDNVHISSDEAWAIALKAFDETDTVILTREILEAKSAVQEIYDSGDTVGARMAFRTAYDRIVKNSPKPVWIVSLGDDQAKRIEAVVQAIAIGRLPPGTEQKYLLHASKDAGPIAGFLTGKVKGSKDNKELKALWHNLFEKIEGIESAIDFSITQRRFEKEEYEKKIKRAKFLEEIKAQSALEGSVDW